MLRKGGGNGAERDLHSALSSSKQTGVFLPMQNVKHNVGEKVAQVLPGVTRPLSSVWLISRMSVGTLGLLILV